MENVLTDSTYLGALGLSTTWLVTLGIVLVVVLAFGAKQVHRWLKRKLLVRRGWSLVNNGREYNKRVYADAVVKLGEQGAQFRSNVVWLEAPQMAAQATGLSTSDAHSLSWSYDIPDFSDSDWRTAVSSGAMRFMQTQQAQEVEELYIDLSALRASAGRLKTAVDAANQSAGKFAGPWDATAKAACLPLAIAAVNAHRQLIFDTQEFHSLHTDFLPEA